MIGVLSVHDSDQKSRSSCAMMLSMCSGWTDSSSFASASSDALRTASVYVGRRNRGIHERGEPPSSKWVHANTCYEVPEKFG